ncbi:hypothetical protein [bacterium endosymbiont of Bathymodiolus sp. 5 South]|uniref:hypothetical protein n=1 Tax=bacterium endosymbiont of Bathymodiolus sp. 5 South TaxID=1181670 RepID=UPI00111867FD|nr:hypothetical protein [bacterium endosymbiont of Bathymodiolus sp. 5 South]
MNNHQNAIFRQLDNFIKHRHSFAMTIFHKITHSAKLVILPIIPTYVKVSLGSFIFYKKTLIETKESISLSENITTNPNKSCPVLNG